MWSHYAENHFGLCLGFETPNLELGFAKEVEYVKTPIKIPPLVDGEFAFRAFITKYGHWQYENEIRMVVPLEEKSGEHYFREFDNHLQLKEVIVGVRSSISKQEIIEQLGIHQDGVKVTKARLAHNAFEVVEDEKGFGCRV